MKINGNDLWEITGGRKHMRKVNKTVGWWTVCSSDVEKVLVDTFCRGSALLVRLLIWFFRVFGVVCGV